MDVLKVSHQSTSSCSVFSDGDSNNLQNSKKLLQIKSFLIKSKNIQKVHVCFPSKIITQLMFTTKLHLGSLHKFYRALLTSLLCVFLMMERPFRIGFCFSCAMSFLCLDQTRTIGVHYLLIFILGLSPQSGIVGFFLEVRKVALATFK